MTIPYSQDALDLAFNVESLLKEAQECAGLEDSTTLSTFAEPLNVLARALDSEARLTPAGRLAVRNALISSLLTQISIKQNIAEHPEINQLQVAQPVFIIGMLRTGSTLVHNLLSQHPGLRVPNLWELMYPAEAGMTHKKQEELANRAQAYVDEYFHIAPELKQIHFLDARQPDECHRLLGNAFQSMVYEMRYRVPGYANWLNDRDLKSAYEYHLQQLKNILWRIPGDVVVLKCPFHAWYLDALVRVYPTARFIHLHRDPTSVVVSTCSLCATIRAGRSDAVDRAEIGQEWLAQIERGVTRMQESRRTYLNDKPVLDIRYNDLMRDIIGVMKQVCNFIGVPMTEQAEYQMRQYLSRNQQHKYGTHRYTPEEFGLDRSDLDGRFPAYRQQYELFPNRDR